MTCVAQKRLCLRWCYTRRFTTTIFNSTKRCNIVAALFRMFFFSFRDCKSCVYNCDGHPSFNFSLRSSHIWFSYIHNFIVSNSYNIAPTLQRCVALKMVVADRPSVTSPFSSLKIPSARPYSLWNLENSLRMRGQITASCQTNMSPKHYIKLPLQGLLVFHYNAAIYERDKTLGQATKMNFNKR